MRRKVGSLFIFLTSIWSEDALSFRRPTSTDENQWRYSAEYKEYQSAGMSGYTSGSHYYGIKIGHAWENEGWSFVSDVGMGSLYGQERLNDNGTTRHVNIQDVIVSLDLSPRFHFSIGQSARFYFGMGASSQLHYTRLPTTITYNRLQAKDIQFAFTSFYLAGFDFLIGDNSRIFIEYSYQDGSAPIYNLTGYKIMGPQAVLGFTW